MGATNKNESRRGHGWVVLRASISRSVKSGAIAPVPRNPLKPPTDPPIMSDFQTLLYEQPAPGVARIVMNRPVARNAQNLAMATS